LQNSSGLIPDSTELGLSLIFTTGLALPAPSAYPQQDCITLRKKKREKVSFDLKKHKLAAYVDYTKKGQKTFIPLHG